MTIVQYQTHQLIRQCALGRLTIARGHLMAVLHGHRGDYDQWAGRVEQYRAMTGQEVGSAKRV